MTDAFMTSRLCTGPMLMPAYYTQQQQQFIQRQRMSVRVLQVDDRPFTSAISQRAPAVCSAHTDNLRQQQFCFQWTSRMEQFTCGTAIKRRHGGDFQKTSEDISV